MTSSKSKSSGDETGATTNSQTSPARVTTNSGSPPLGHTEVDPPAEASAQAKATAPPKKSLSSRPTLRSKDKPSRSSRSTSVAGGVQVVLDETGSWSGLTDPNSTIPSEGQTAQHKGKQGMLGFLTRKGRGSSPKPQEPGVLGREGARQIIS